MQAGINRVGRLGLALLTALAMVTALVIVLAGPAQADHVPHDFVDSQGQGEGFKNETPYWENTALPQHGIEGASCWKVNDTGSDDPYFLGNPPAGEVWVAVIIKQGTANYVWLHPQANHTYPSPDEAPGDGGFSHVIVCTLDEEPEETTTTTEPEETTTTTEPEETTTTTEPEETTTTEPEETTTTTEPEETTTTTEPEETTTTVEDEVLGEEVTTTQPEETTTTVEDEVLGEELPFTGIENEGLALVAAALTTLGLLVTLSARRIEE